MENCLLYVKYKIVNEIDNSTSLLKQVRLDLSMTYIGMPESPVPSEAGDADAEQLAEGEEAEGAAETTEDLAEGENVEAEKKGICSFPLFSQVHVSHKYQYN